jgi:hypothetical protein
MDPLLLHELGLAGVTVTAALGPGRAMEPVGGIFAKLPARSKPCPASTPSSAPRGGSQTVSRPTA